MAYITLDDLSRRMPARLLQQLIAGPDDRVQNAIATAIEEAEGYLRPRFETEIIFGRTGSDRHPVLVRVVIDLALYHLESQAETEGHTELRLTAREDALDWLKSAAKGQIDPGEGMPLRPDTSGTGPVSSYQYNRSNRPKSRY